MIDLTQVEADELLAMEKHRINEDRHRFGALRLEIPLRSVDQRENFFLDVGRGRINLVKGNYQTRAKLVVILARVDFGGAPHRNPDGEEIASPHLHVYREGYADKWAHPLPPEAFTNPNDSWVILEEFLRFCNVTQPPIFEQELFV
jgi:hypothetical protein